MILTDQLGFEFENPVALKYLKHKTKFTKTTQFYI